MADKEYAWYIERNQLGIVEKVSGEWKSITEAGKSIRIFCSALVPHFSVDLDGQSEIPAQFHQALVNKVISEGYKDPRNLNLDLAQYFEGEYIKGVKSAKKYARMHHYSSAKIIPQEF
jgi:hypothetical protein